MENNLQMMMKKQKRRKIWLSTLGIMMCIVVFCTTYALILPAITMEPDTWCGKEEHKHEDKCFQEEMICQSHTHGDECYARQSELICAKEEEAGHLHTDACAPLTESILSCGMEESAGHTHTEECEPKTEKNLVCEQEEGGEHTHSEPCYTTIITYGCGLPETEGHTHDDTCYTPVTTYGCGLEETAGHTHGEECYSETTVLTCELEAEEHAHTEACYENQLTCELEEHTHSLACYSDPTADVETAANWEATLPDELTGVYAQDVLAVAESQLGYTESIRNYIVSESGEMQGYTRYGEWYGNPHGDWCAMFASFCLHYAGVEDFPLEASCSKWVADLTEKELYREAGAYEPQPGDLVFFNQDEDEAVDHVGIVVEMIPADGETPAKLRTIEGNSGNTVKYNKYTLDDDSIMGYSRLPSNEVPVTTQRATIYTDATFGTVSDDPTVIALTGPLPENAAVRAFPVSPDTNHSLICAYDIRIILPDGSEYEPPDDQTVSVSVQFNEEQAETAQDTDEVAVYYLPEDGEAELVASEKTDEGVVFYTDHFSVYAFVDENSVKVDTAAELASAITGAGNATIYIKLVDDFRANIDPNGGDIAGSIGLPAGSDVYLDLNGHTISHSGTDALFTIPDNATLVILDSTIGPESVKTIDSPTSLVANPAVLEHVAESDDNRLTYYVTTSAIVNSSTGQTEEKLEKRTIQVNGGIQAGTQPVFQVSGGTLNIDGGFIYGGSNRAILQSGGVTNLLNGYICGFENTSEGGAIYTTGGTLNIGNGTEGSGTVLAGNSAYRGGAIFAQNTTVNMTGGIISGNCSSRTESSTEGASHYGGGGMFLNNCGSAVMTGGYITNNLVQSNGYFDGGGGILASGNTNLKITDGYITGNSASSGGGIRTDWQRKVALTMEGGYVCSNLARKCEGGGISVNIQGTAIIIGGYINNNVTATPSDWGGGGVFGSTGSTMYIHNVLITNNHAGGYGGGVAGCSTGRVYICVQEGGAIYTNTADGKNMSGSTSTKNEDWVYAYNNEVFMNNGYQDYFCALNSIVEGSMLGGQPAYWVGSADGVPVRPSGSDTLVAAYVMGLTANPTAQGKEVAQKLAKVYINGNTSNTHGGGILCNGYMIIGEPDQIEVGARIELKASKEFLGPDAEKLTLQENQFTFTVTDAQTGAVLATASNNAKGEIEFKERIPFTQEGTFVYYIREVPGSDSDIVFDTTTYRMTVVVNSQESFFEKVLINDQEVTVKKIQYLLDKITIEKQNQGSETWEEVSDDDNPQNSDDKAITIELSSGATFTNVKQENINIRVEKKWDDNGSSGHPDSVTVNLMQNGTRYGESVVLKESNQWSHIWENLPVVDEDGATKFTYSVEEVPVNGYIPEYELISNVQSQGYWLPVPADEKIQVGQYYAIVSPDHQYALYVTDDVIDGHFSEAQKKLVTTQSVSFNGTEYGYAIPDSGIDARSTFTPEETKAFDNLRIILRNTGVNGNSWLLAQGSGNSRLKGCNSPDYSSGIQYRDGKIWIQYEWQQNNQWRVLTYENDMFNSVEAEEATNSQALLYKFVFTQVSADTTVRITNHRIENQTYTLDITKLSGLDTNVRLGGAEFQLLQGDTPLHFTRVAEGAYTLSADETNDVLITANKTGKLVLRGLPAGSYTLKEISPPQGYDPIEDKTVVLGSADDGNVSLTVQLELVDMPTSYELPETGGTGTQMYTMAGLMLVTASMAFLLYRKRKRRREDS